MFNNTHLNLNYMCATQCTLFIFFVERGAGGGGGDLVIRVYV